MLYQNLTVRPVLFGVAGDKNTGKTTLMEELIRRLTNRGWKVAAIKHDGHDFEADREGTDSWRHYHAGAYGTVVFSNRKYQLVKEEKDISLEKLTALFPEADVILIEGMKQASHEKYRCRYPKEEWNAERLVGRIEEKIRDERSNSMTIETLMEKISLPKEGQDCVQDFPMTETFYQSFKELFYEDSKAFFAEADRRTDRERLYLYLYIRMAADLYPAFVEKGISGKVYVDTFYDITIWYNQCVKKKGVPGLVEERWLSLALRMKIFSLGRLQFEPDEDRHVLHVHIPEGEPLDDAACGESFAIAEEFFGPEYTIFDCESWLLSPKLQKLLKPDSNILKFQNRFQIEKIIYPFRQAEERVFGRVREDKEQYPESTSLQRAVKAMVLTGEDVGIGYGVIYRK